SSFVLSLESAAPAPEKERLSWEKELLGLYVSSHPLRRVKNIIEARAVPISRITKGQNQGAMPVNPYQFSRAAQRMRIAGVVSLAKKIITKSGKSMFFVKLEDLTDVIEVVVFPNLLEKNPLLFQEGGKYFLWGGIPISVSGRKSLSRKRLKSW
ncbi:MAG: hypothetical protein HYU05_00425, partial [Candidatus Wildermuthbacteria bacterium]|nr:hypothetical protein [Candidatus Wildermuthbacteria bacterium]